jgi:hypothetical protein
MSQYLLFRRQIFRVKKKPDFHKLIYHLSPIHITIQIIMVRTSDQNKAFDFFFVSTWSARKP